MARPGRPTKLVPERVERLLEAIRVGNYINTAVVYAGITEATFYRWLEIGEANKEGKYREFLESVKKAEADAEARQVALISKAANETWQAAAWLLERKHPARWGQRNKTEVTGKEGGPIQVDIDAKAKLFGIISDGAARIRDSEATQQALTVGSSGNTLRLDGVGTP